MDKQLTADRERVAAIARAEGEARNIKLTTDAKNKALVETAQAQAQATKTRADAESYRITKIQEALKMLMIITSKIKVSLLLPTSLNQILI